MQREDYKCKIDLKDSYFSVPIHKDSQQLVSFQWEELERSPLPLFWSWPNTNRFYQVTKILNVSAELFDDLNHNILGQSLNFRAYYEKNTHGTRLSNFSFTALTRYNKLLGTKSGDKVSGYGCKFQKDDIVFNLGKHAKGEK